jgi:hypothetical protein
MKIDAWLDTEPWRPGSMSAVITNICLFGAVTAGPSKIATERAGVGRILQTALLIRSMPGPRGPCRVSAGGRTVRVGQGRGRARLPAAACCPHCPLT